MGTDEGGKCPRGGRGVGEREIHAGQVRRRVLRIRLLLEGPLQEHARLLVAAEVEELGAHDLRVDRVPRFGQDPGREPRPGDGLGEAQIEFLRGRDDLRASVHYRNAHHVVGGREVGEGNLLEDVG